MALLLSDTLSACTWRRQKAIGLRRDHQPSLALGLLLPSHLGDPFLVWGSRWGCLESLALTHNRRLEVFPLFQKPVLLNCKSQEETSPSFAFLYQSPSLGPPWLPESGEELREERKIIWVNVSAVSHGGSLRLPLACPRSELQGNPPLESLIWSSRKGGRDYLLHPGVLKSLWA